MTTNHDALREALEMIAGYKQCPDSLMSNQDIARAALSQPLPEAAKPEPKTFVKRVGDGFVKQSDGTWVKPEPQAQAGEPRPWDHINDVLPVLVAAANGKWSWVENTECKYIELRIDMRDGGCIIKNRRGERITPEQLAKQPWKQGGVPWGNTTTTDHSHREAIAKRDAALQACVDDLRAIKATLERENEKPDGPISDTIWHTRYETLFDFVYAAIQQAEEARK